MSKEKQNNREYVEAVPGPAIVITREEYEKMKNSENLSAKKRLKNDETLKKFKEQLKRSKEEDLSK